MQLKAFISYSTDDKNIAGQVKTVLNEHGIVAFLAHDDIHVSQEWKDRLIQELNETNIFIPLLSRSFKESDWAPHDLLLEPIITRFTHEIIPTLIERLAGARSFLSAEALMLPLARHFDKFNDEEIDRFATAAIENNQIWDEHNCRKQHLPAFIKLHRLRMDPEKLKALEYQVELRQWYHLRTDA